jgi:micrococcal nuclease
MPLALALVFALLAPGARAAAPRPLEGHVVYVVDGDTIHVQLADQIEKVRYIGVNTPEVPHAREHGERRAPRHLPHSVAAGEAAKRANWELVAGQRVRLDLDQRRRDPHRRLLAYVWSGDTMVNAELVRRGYAEVMSVPPDFRHRALFVTLQAEACAAGRGLWGIPRAAAHPRACDKLR